MPSLFVDIFWLILGLVALYFGAEYLVKGSSRLALKFGISPLVVGLTVVAFGTSAPELFVAFGFNGQDLPDMAMGSVIGSNICNIGLILGLSSLFYALTVKSDLLRRDVPLLILGTAVFIFFIWDKELSQIEGGILFGGLLIQTAWTLTSSRRESKVVHEEFAEELDPNAAKASPMWQLIVMIFVGLIGLYFGAEWLQKGGINLARTIGVPEAVISLTMIALATSIPELATSIIAARQKEGDIITGNVIGSCIFNLLCVMGLTASVKPMTLTEISVVDLSVMALFTLILLPMMWTRKRIDRWEGAVLLIAYFSYVAYLYLGQQTPA